MSIWITGDIHGDPRRLTTKHFPEQKGMCKDDYVIILGDFGLIWSGSKEEESLLNWLNEKPFTTVFVDGNHENFDLLNSYPVVDYHGGKAHKIRESVYHLMRGYVFDICGKKCFCFGGARSHDINDGILDVNDFESKEKFKQVYRKYRKENKVFRVNHVSWWEEEMPNQEEMERGRLLLQENDNKIHFVFSHCAPQEIASLIGHREPDELTTYFNGLLYDGIVFDRWLFGHYHDNIQIMGKFILLYEQIIQIA